MIRYDLIKASSMLIALSVVAFTFACSGDGGSAESDPAEHEHAGESVTIWTDRVELFMEYPPLVAGEEGEPWAVHLTDLTDFKPVVQGRLTLRFEGPDGEHVTVVEAPQRPGVYTPAPALPAGGSYDLVMELSGSQVTDEIFVGPVLVYGSHDDIPHLPEPESVGITFLKEQQWPIEFATAPAIERAIPRSVAATGAVTPAANGMAAVTAPVDGMVLPRDNRSAPVPGEWVAAGGMLAILSPVSGDNAYGVQLARERRLAREVERVERLVAAEAVPARRLEEARHELDLARASLQSLGVSPDDGYALELRSPIGGVVDERHLTLGSRVQAGDLLFSIIDTRLLWARFDVPAARAPDAARISEAVFTVEGSSRVYRSERVISVGRVIAPDRRTLRVLFAVANTDGSLKVGMLTEGRLLLGDPTTGVTVPSQAVQDEDGIAVAYVQIGGESFERRALTLGPSDGEWTIVQAGVRAGERVVTLGSYQVKLASFNTAEISDHGHPH